MIEKEIKSCTLDNSENISTEFDKEVYTSQKRKLARQKAQEKGFEDEYHFEGFLYFNRLNGSPLYTGYEVDILHHMENGGFEE